MVRYQDWSVSSRTPSSSRRPSEGRASWLCFQEISARCRSRTRIELAPVFDRMDSFEKRIKQKDEYFSPFQPTEEFSPAMYIMETFTVAVISGRGLMCLTLFGPIDPGSEYACVQSLLLMKLLASRGNTVATTQDGSWNVGSFIIFVLHSSLQSKALDELAHGVSRT